MGRVTRIGIVTCADSTFLDHDHDSVPLAAALERRGATAAPVAWTDPHIDWSRYDLLVIRSPWDWVQRAGEFQEWLARASAASRILNDPELIRWNLDKRYLEELASRGIPVVPTVHVDDAAAIEPGIAEAATGSADSHVVVKPAISAGSQRSGLFRADDPAASTLATEIVAAGGTAMIQPEVPELSAGHEKALYLIDGILTHAVAKGALLERGGGLIGGSYQEHPVLADASEAEHGFAAQVLEAVAAATGLSRPLYARVDAVESAAMGRVLLEVELFEPALNLHLAPAAAEVLADAILARIRAGGGQSAPG